MRVRQSTTGDRDFVLGLAVRFAEFPLPAWRRRETIVAGTAAQLAGAFDQQGERSTFLIAENESGPQGFAWVLMLPDFYTGEDVGKISEIAVARDGGGAGSALMRASEAWARARGARLITLNVMDENRRARDFYERHGYGPEYTMLAKRLDD